MANSLKSSPDGVPRDPRHLLVLLGTEWLAAQGSAGGLSARTLIDELSANGFVVHRVSTVRDVEAALRESPIGAAILDLQAPPPSLYAAYDLTHSPHRVLPCLLLGSSQLQPAGQQYGALDPMDGFVRVDEGHTAEYILLFLRALLLRAYPDAKRLLEQRPSQAETALNELVCVFSAKGGTGKTTVACNLAVALARDRKKQVALIDGDLYFGDVDIQLGLPSTTDGRRRSLSTAVDALHLPSGSWDERCELSLTSFDQKLLEEVLHHHPSGLRVLPAPPRPEMAERIPPAVFRQAVELCRRRFEYTIVDMCSSYSDAEIQLLDAATRIVVVLKPEMSCLRNTTLLLDYAAQFGWRDRVLLVLNRADSNRFTQISRDTVEQHLGASVIPVISSGTIPQAASEGRPVIESHPDSKVAASLRGLVEAIDGQTRESSPSIRGLRGLFAGRFTTRRNGGSADA